MYIEMMIVDNDDLSLFDSISIASYIVFFRVEAFKPNKDTNLQPEPDTGKHTMP